MIALIEAGGRAGAKRMKFRLSSNAGFTAALGKLPFTIDNPTETTIDLEVEFGPKRSKRIRRSFRIAIGGRSP